MFKWDLGDGAELRILEARHAPEFLGYVEDNREFLGRWLPWAVSIKSEEDAGAFIKRGITRFADDGLPWVGIWQDGVLVGGLLFFPIDRIIKATEIGYWLSENAGGKGLMTRAVRAMLSLAFDQLQLNRVGINCEVDNAPSRRLAERLGFALEGTKRHGWVNDGEYVDVAMYSMLAKEWQAAKAD